MKISNSDIAIYTDKTLADGVSLMVYPHPWHKAILEHINVLGLKAIKIGIYTYCTNKDFLHVKDMVWQSHSCQLFQQYGDIKSQTCNDIVRRIWDFYAKN